MTPTIAFLLSILCNVVLLAYVLFHLHRCIDDADAITEHYLTRLSAIHIALTRDIDDLRSRIEVNEDRIDTLQEDIGQIRWAGVDLTKEHDLPSFLRKQAD